MINKKTIQVDHKRINAFTLIEVLVVIVIVSLLLGIIVPSLQRARQTARNLICQTRLHQWGLAFGIYATENEGYYPHIDGRDRTSTDPATDEQIADYYYGWVDMLPPLMGEESWRDWSYYKKPDATTIFQCPSAKPSSPESYSYRIDRSGYFSYAMNSCLELDSNCWPPHGNPGGNNMPSFLKSTLIKQPSQVILLYDQLLDPFKGYGGMRYNPTAGKYCGSYPKAFSVRHNRNRTGLGGFVLHCDLRVEWTSSVWKDTWPDVLEVPPRDDSNWYPY